jgi:hypothetical protein
LRKIKEFHEYVAQNKVNYDKNYYSNDQLILLFLQGNAYKPKDALDSMANNLTLRKQYLPQNYEQNKKAIVISLIIFRIVASFTHAVGTGNSDRSWFSTPNLSTGRMYKTLSKPHVLCIRN